MSGLLLHIKAKLLCASFSRFLQLCILEQTKFAIYLGKRDNGSLKIVPLILHNINFTIAVETLLCTPIRVTLTQQKEAALLILPDRRKITKV